MKHKKHSKAANKTASKRELQTSLFIFSTVLLFTQKQQRVRKECTSTQSCATRVAQTYDNVF